VKELLFDLRKGRTRDVERALLFHRTLAEPRFLDGSIDPNDRKIGWCFLGDPEGSNTSPAGVARFSTLRAWLSQWSIDDTQAKSLVHAPRLTVPLLAIENTADDAVPQPHIRQYFEAAGSVDKSFRTIKGANHYYSGQPNALDEVVNLTRDWLRVRNLFD
jgi:hypothetical protein